MGLSYHLVKSSRVFTPAAGTYILLNEACKCVNDSPYGFRSAKIETKVAVLEACKLSFSLSVVVRLVLAVDYSLH